MGGWFDGRCCCTTTTYVIVFEFCVDVFLTLLVAIETSLSELPAWLTVWLSHWLTDWLIERVNDDVANRWVSFVVSVVVLIWLLNTFTQSIIDVTLMLFAFDRVLVCSLSARLCRCCAKESATKGRLIRVCSELWRRSPCMVWTCCR